MTLGAVITNWNDGLIQHGICFDGQYFWVNDYIDAVTTKLRCITREGEIIKSFTSPVTRGMCFDGQYIWGIIPGTILGGGNTIKCFTREGIVIKSFIPAWIPLGVVLYGIGFDGQHLLLADASYTYKVYYTTRNLVHQKSLTISMIGAIDFDGQYLWFLADGLNKMYKVSRV